MIQNDINIRSWYLLDIFYIFTRVVKLKKILYKLKMFKIYTDFGIC